MSVVNFPRDTIERDQIIARVVNRLQTVPIGDARRCEGYLDGLIDRRKTLVVRLGDGTCLCERHYRLDYGDAPVYGWVDGRCDRCTATESHE